MALKSRTHKCRAVTCMESKLTCIKHAFFFSVPLDYSYNDFLE
jgi:hypothetical protein